MPLMDFSYLLGGKGVELDDPLTVETRALTLAELMNRKKMNEFTMRKQQREEDAMAALNEVLPQVHAAGYTPEAINAALQRRPESGGLLLDALEKKRKADVDIRKSGAESLDKEVSAKSKALTDIGNAAYTFAKNPTPNSLPFLRSMAKTYGIELPTPPGDPRDPGALTEYFQSLGDTVYAIKDRVNAQETNRANLVGEAQRGANYLSEAKSREQQAAIGWANVGLHRESNQIARTAADQNRMDAQTLALGNQIDKKGLDALSATMRNLNTTLDTYSTKKDIPGVGVVTGFVPGFALSAAGKKVRSDVQAVANDLLKLYSGGAVTLNEAQRRAIEMMQGGGFNEEDLYAAWPMVVERYNEAVRNVSAGYRPDAVAQFKARGGTALEPIVPAVRNVGGFAGTGGSIAGQPITGLGGIKITKE